MMRPYADVDYESKSCVHKYAAQLFGLGIKGIQDTTGWDLPVIMKRISEESGVTLNSIRQMRTGDRDPRRSAAAVSAAITRLGGPKIVFPSQSADGKGAVVSDAVGQHGETNADTLPNEAGKEPVAPIAITLTLAEAKRRLAATFDAPVSAIKIIGHD
ncbi:hypothetical protein [Siccirubricoccus sp. G192]|uniref:hypothetical protein n=1 Tax=Siccirubricoccus sp. G192 TaxID=2849651 RepID=UPI001C2C50C3|nr:hypothetical protein [Siccirubricoccus sp. G192]MBV1800059.1 hypothetical protein [Siccirubricoccus sp. G192]